MMTGDSRVNKHRTASDLLTELRRRTPLMQDKAVQFTSYDEHDHNYLTNMDDTSANPPSGYDNHMVANDIGHNSQFEIGHNSHVLPATAFANDNVSSVTVAEINSPTSTDDNGPSSPIYSKPYQRGGGGGADSEDSGLVDEGVLCSDGVDSATLELRPKHFIGSHKMDNEAVDEIREQTSPPSLGNNCVYKEQKLKEQFETKDDTNNNCALDCLAFTLECCQCVIL